MTVHDCIIDKSKFSNKMKTTKNLMTEENFEDLKERGYTVVKNVVGESDCDVYIQQYRDWLKQFKNGAWPVNMHSCIQKYRIAHMEPSWNVRLKSKKVFEEIWKTDQLLSSYDSVAIACPPDHLDTPNNLYANDVATTGWLHCDQTYLREGLHGYQGAVYLEETSEKDWTLEILEGSHKLFEEFFQNSDHARIRSILNHVYQVKPSDREWYRRKGCIRKTIAVPKGGMVLWDSRLIHANSRPRENRPVKDRWRFCVMVCMAPKVWANDETLEMKKSIYRDMLMTTHWPCDNVGFAKHMLHGSDKENAPPILKELPPIAKTDEAKRLAGVLPYPNEKTDPCKLPVPKWRMMASKQIQSPDTFYFDYKQLFKLLSYLAIIVAIIVGFFLY